MTKRRNALQIIVVISEASRNTRYRMGSVVKTAVRNLLTDYRLTDYFVRLQATFRTSELTRHVPSSVRSALLASLRELKVVDDVEKFSGQQILQIQVNYLLCLEEFLIEKV